MLSDLFDERGTEKGIWLYLKDIWETQNYTQKYCKKMFREIQNRN